MSRRLLGPLRGWCGRTTRCCAEWGLYRGRRGHYRTVVSRVSTVSGRDRIPDALVNRRSRRFALVHACTRRAGAPLARFGRGRLLELDHFALEVGQLLEALVDRREPEIRNRVEVAQVLEHP